MAIAWTPVILNRIPALGECSFGHADGLIQRSNSLLRLPGNKRTSHLHLHA
jgi:hypothetical protein